MPAPRKIPVRALIAYRRGASFNEVARQFGLKPDSFRWFVTKVNPSAKKGRPVSRKRVLTPRLKSQILKDVENWDEYGSIAKRYGLNVNTVKAFVNRNSEGRALKTKARQLKSAKNKTGLLDEYIAKGSISSMPRGRRDFYGVKNAIIKESRDRGVKIYFTPTSFKRERRAYLIGKAKTLQAKGMTVQQIAKELNVPYDSARGYLRRT